MKCVKQTEVIVPGVHDLTTLSNVALSLCKVICCFVYLRKKNESLFFCVIQKSGSGAELKDDE